MLELKISRAAPRKISVLLCQVSVVIAVLFNVSNETVTKFTVWQKCA